MISLTSRRLIQSASKSRSILNARSILPSTLQLQSRCLRSLADLENPVSSSSSSTVSSSSIIEPLTPASSTPLIPHTTSKSSSSKTPGLILTLSCPDQPGIVSKVTSYLATRGCNILDSAQYFDQSTKTFFMRVHSSWDERARDKVALKGLEEDFRVEIAKGLKMNFQLNSDEGGMRTMIMVSKVGRE